LFGYACRDKIKDIRIHVGLGLASVAIAANTTGPRAAARWKVYGNLFEYACRDEIKDIRIQIGLGSLALR